MGDSFIEKEHVESIYLLICLSSLPVSSIKLSERCVHSSAIANAIGNIIDVQAALKRENRIVRKIINTDFSWIDNQLLVNPHW